MYRAVRTDARPPQTIRLPRSVPLSRASGATPTSFCLWLLDVITHLPNGFAHQLQSAPTGFHQAHS